MSRSLVFISAIVFALAGAAGTRAETANCTAGDYAAAVDRSGAALSAASREIQPKVQERMRRYQAAKGLSDVAYEGAALEAIQDKTLEDLDVKSSELLLKIDGLGRIPDGKDPNCAELGDIDAMSKELLSVVRAKSEYILARLDAKIAEAGGKPAAAKESAAKENTAEASGAKEKVAKPEAAPPETTSQTPQAQPPPQPGTNPPAGNGEAWSAKTKANDAYVAPPSQTAQAQADAPANTKPAATPDSPDGYSIEEIQDATRGFFGTFSTGLASVIEHTFKTSGRPSAYVLGSEGGGAFLAGLRFGDGTLYMRNRPEHRKVWWHGPSIGGDFGASGTRTMFLIYKLDSQDALFRTFTGVDGSAFLVGGVGVTVLKGGDVIMAPIRTGLGFRVGASLGYVRFTPKPTWNPF
ncbi:MAG: DUF1134 domain-containing protein [Hyphomicrobium sp.]